MSNGGMVEIPTSLYRLLQQQAQLVTLLSANQSSSSSSLCISSEHSLSYQQLKYSSSIPSQPVTSSACRVLSSSSSLSINTSLTQNSHTFFDASHVSTSTSTSTSATPPVSAQLQPQIHQRTQLAYSSKSVFVDSLVSLTSSILASMTPHPNSQALYIPFIRELLRRSRTSFSTLQLALMYLLRHSNTMSLKSRQNQNRTQQQQQQPHSTLSHPYPYPQDQTKPSSFQCTNPRLLFLASLMTATKFLADRAYSNKAWADITGVSVAVLNEAERMFLAGIEYTLFVGRAEFLKFCALVQRLCCGGAASTGTGSGKDQMGMMKEGETGGSGVELKEGGHVGQHPYLNHNGALDVKGAGNKTCEPLTPPTCFEEEFASGKKRRREEGAEDVGGIRKLQCLE